MPQNLVRLTSCREHNDGCSHSEQRNGEEPDDPDADHPLDLPGPRERKAGFDDWKRSQQLNKGNSAEAKRWSGPRACGNRLWAQVRGKYSRIRLPGMLWSLGPEARPWQAAVTAAGISLFFATGMTGLLAMQADDAGQSLTRAVLLGGIAGALMFPLFLMTSWRLRHPSDAQITASRHPTTGDPAP